MTDGKPSVVVLLPVFDDWPALLRLLPMAAAQLTGATSSFAFLVVDDGSTSPPPASLNVDLVPGAAWLRVLHLRRNLGHQKAIAVGLSYLDEHGSFDAAIVMDADGEDRADHLPLLLQRLAGTEGRAIVFAERRRRAEGLTFRLFYLLYRALHLALTGRRVRVGNFSVVPRERVASLVVVSELWIHYAASAIRSRQPIVTVPSDRGPRLEGRSRMSFVPLVVHGLSAISVYSDVVFTRVVMASSVVAATSVLGIVAILGVRLRSALAVPEWAALALLLLLLLVLFSAAFAISLTLVVLGAQQHAGIIPRRDCGHFILRVRELTGRAWSSERGLETGQSLESGKIV